MGHVYVMEGMKMLTRFYVNVYNHQKYCGLFCRSVTKCAVLESVSSQLLIHVLFVWLAMLMRLHSNILLSFSSMWCVHEADVKLW